MYLQPPFYGTRGATPFPVLQAPIIFYNFNSFRVTRDTWEPVVHALRKNTLSEIEPGLETSRYGSSFLRVQIVKYPRCKPCIPVYSVNYP